MVKRKRAVIAEYLKPFVESIDSLILDEANARAHPERSIEALRQSLSMYGQTLPIMVNDGNVVIKGNGLLMAARALGWTEMAVARVDWDEDKKKGYAIMDNQSALLSDWNLPMLASQLQALEQAGFPIEGTGFNAAELHQLVMQAKPMEILGKTGGAMDGSNYFANVSHGTAFWAVGKVAGIVKIETIQAVEKKLLEHMGEDFEDDADRQKKASTALQSLLEHIEEGWE